MLLRIFGWSIGVTVAALVTAFFYGGATAFALCLILGILEVSLSFDNAVVNAKILRRMSDFWQKMFLTVGIIIAVFGMRLVFPLLIVGITASLGPVEAVQLALEGGDIDEPGTYAYTLDQAHPQIAAFGGMFLFMLFLDFIFEEREIHWLGPIEKPLQVVGRVEKASVIVAVVSLILVAEFLAEDTAVVLLSGVLGLVTYLAVNGLGQAFESSNIAEVDDDEPADDRLADASDDALERAGSPGTGSGTGGSTSSTATATKEPTAKTSGPSGIVRATGKAAFFLFLYLEVLDASFSFDGVIGAFAITSDPIIIALGLGFIGAMFVRSITIYLVRAGTLDDYVYLDHGAHWAIGALATILLVSIGFHVDEIITGLVGVAFIGAAFWTSIRRNRRLAATEPERTTVEV